MRQHAQTYAITAVTHNRRRLFQRTEMADCLISTLFRYRDANKFQLHGFVVMPDHIHAIVTPASDHTIERCAQLIKGGFSFAIRQSAIGQIWQDGYYAHRVTDEDDLRNQLECILTNPIRKQYVDYPHIHTTEAYATRLDHVSNDLIRHDRSRHRPAVAPATLCRCHIAPFVVASRGRCPCF